MVFKKQKMSLYSKTAITTVVLGSFVLAASDANARSLHRQKLPSIEINFEVLDSLRQSEEFSIYKEPVVEEKAEIVEEDGAEEEILAVYPPVESELVAPTPVKKAAKKLPEQLEAKKIAKKPKKKSPAVKRIIIAEIEEKKPSQKSRTVVYRKKPQVIREEKVVLEPKKPVEVKIKKVVAKPKKEEKLAKAAAVIESKPVAKAADKLVSPVKKQDVAVSRTPQNPEKEEGFLSSFIQKIPFLSELNTDKEIEDELKNLPEKIGDSVAKKSEKKLLLPPVLRAESKRKIQQEKVRFFENVQIILPNRIDDIASLTLPIPTFRPKILTPQEIAIKSDPILKDIVEIEKPKDSIGKIKDLLTKNIPEPAIPNVTKIASIVNVQPKNTYMEEIIELPQEGKNFVVSEVEWKNILDAARQKAEKKQAKQDVEKVQAKIAQNQKIPVIKVKKQNLLKETAKITKQERGFLASFIDMIPKFGAETKNPGSPKKLAKREVIELSASAGIDDLLDIAEERKVVNTAKETQENSEKPVEIANVSEVDIPKIQENMPTKPTNLLKNIVEFNKRKIDVAKISESKKSVKKTEKPLFPKINMAIAEPVKTVVEIPSSSKKPREMIVKNKVDIKKSNADFLSVSFADSQQIEISDFDKDRIAELVQKVKNKNSQIRIISHAEGIEGQASSARRISLQRAINIRSHMIQSGLESVKINVQAVGNRNKDIDTPNSTSIYVVGAF